jgi:hypothetical protein
MHAAAPFLVGLGWSGQIILESTFRGRECQIGNGKNVLKNGADVMIFKNICAKKIGEKMSFLQNLIITSVFEKNTIFSAENWQRTQGSMLRPLFSAIFTIFRAKKFWRDS